MLKENNSPLASNGFMRSVFQKTISVGASLFYSLLGFGLLLGMWYIVSLITKGELPTPFATLAVFWELVTDPFYDYGPNDKGIGLQLFSSLVRVFIGFSLGSLVAIPVGLLMGANAFCKKVFYPIVQILKPVSPLAWFPIGLVVFQSASKKQGWDGFYKGKLQPIDTYGYTLDVEFTDGKKLRKTGDITLLR